MPPVYRGRTAALLTEIEQLAVEPDQPARVLVDEQSGIIVMGDNVRISQVAVAQGNLTVRVTETPQVSQPNPLAEGDTVVVPRTRVEVDEGGGRNMVVLQEGVSLQELVAGLNALGVGTARPDQHSAGDQGGRRAAGRDRGDVMTEAIQAPDAGRRPARRQAAGRRRQPMRLRDGRAGVRGGLPGPGAGPAQPGPAAARRAGQACFTTCSMMSWQS